MLDSGYLGQLIAGLFYLIVGVALLRLSHRTGEKPERNLGFYFLFTGVDYSGYSAAGVFRLDAIFEPCAFISRAAYVIAVVFLVIFIRDVFRRGETWASWLATICSLGLIVPIIVTGLQGVWVVTAENPWFWPDYFGYSIPLTWLTFEAFRAHSGARKRLRVGLCDRAVVNRYMLWGCFGIFQVLACVVILLAEINLGPGGAVYSSGQDFLLSVSEIASIALLWLAFFPPAAYLSWVTGSGATLGVATASQATTSPARAADTDLPAEG